MIKKNFLNQILSDKKFVFAVLVLILCNFAIYKNLFSADENDDAFKSDFPSTFSDWTSTEVKYNPDDIATLDPDKTIYRDYHDKAGHTVNLFIACYNSFTKADLSHSPVVCFTGQGWDIQETSVADVQLALPDNQVIKVNRILLKKADLFMVTFYWYQSKKMAFRNRGLQKIYLFFQELFGSSSANAFIRLTAMVDRGEAAQKTNMLLSDFTKELYPEMRRYYN